MRGRFDDLGFSYFSIGGRGIFTYTLGMLKVMLVGNAPLPKENTNSRPAAGLRTWQFIKGLSDGADIELHAVTIGMPECYEKKPEKGLSDGGFYKRYFINKDSVDLHKWVQEVHDEVHPDVIVSVNTFPSYITSKLKTKTPFWADLNGWIMAEGQAQAAILESNAYIPHYYRMEQSILARADRFSTVSENQKYAVYGELAAMGRVRKENFGEELVARIGNAQEDLGERSELKEDYFVELDGKFLVLWIGGYNTWADEETLFRGLEKAMEKCDDLYFVSTGGGIEGLNNATFKRFKERIDKSKYRDRFKFLGWVETAEIPKIYERADCGINVDKMCLETWTGARNRINEMMKYGVPVVTTLGSEIADLCVNVGAGIGVKSGDSKALAKALERIYREEDKEKYGNAGKKFTEENSYKRSLKPLLEWIKNPKKNGPNIINYKGGSGIAFLKSSLLYLKERGLRNFLKRIGRFFK